MKFRQFVLGLFATFAFAASAIAGTVVVTWSAASDPAVGWNLYFNHLQTPDALQYIGTTGASNRTTTLNNISATGLYQFGISRVEYVDVAGVNRRIEGPIEVITVLDGQVITTPNSTVVTSVTFNP